MSSTRARPFIRSDNGQGTPKKRHVSEEGRQRLSELAKARHAAGGFKQSADGATVPKKRSKKAQSKDRVAQMVAEAALEKKNAEAIIEVFKDGIAEHQPMTIRLKAAEAWLGIEREEGKLALKEQDLDSQKRDRKELLDILSKRLMSGHAATLIRKQIEAHSDEDIIDVQPISEEVIRESDS